MDICAEIEKAESSTAEFAYNYAKSAIFGNQTMDMFYKLLQMNSMIATLRRAVPRTVKVKQAVTSVEFSSLRIRNNSLILDASALSQCVDVDVRLCLSDEEICTLVENLQVICKNTNC